MQFDPEIIATRDGFDVIADVYTITWPDGSSVELHRVLAYGYPETFLRAMRTDSAEWLIFDARQVTSVDLERDIKALPLRDHPGAVAHHLRWAHIDAAAACMAMAAKATLRWATQAEAKAVPA